jgi:hypothetical protein
MSDKPDWEAIRRDFEAGNGSFREIADRHNVKLTTLHDRSRKWQKPNAERRTPNNPNAEQEGEQSNISSIHALRLIPVPSPANAVAAANLGLGDLLELMEKSRGKMDFADHVKASNAMAQYNKIIINAPPEEEEEEQKDFSAFSDDELRQYAEYEERATKKRA